MALEASVPSTPRKGSYLAVVGLTDQEGGGDVRIEVEECPTCYAVVEGSKLESHTGRHDAETGAAPKF
jgi:hypothetical protein